MVREILFRGKNKHGTWYYGFYTEGYCLDGTPVSWIEVVDRRKKDTECPTVIPETVGQFTGLTDKHGKKIFEGDICRVSRPCVLAYGKITFQNGCFWFVDDGPGGMLRLCDVKMNGFEIEVIGNIHDNPELLEVTDNA